MSKTQKRLPKHLLTVLWCSLLLLTATSALAHEEETLTGFLIDEHCFWDHQSDPGADTRSCKLSDTCVTGGYGLAVKNEDDTYNFYFFDGDFFSSPEADDGTGGQKIAHDFILANQKEDYLPVTIKANQTHESRASLVKNEKSFDLIKLETIREASDHEAKDLPKEAHNSGAHISGEHKIEGHEKKHNDHNPAPDHEKKK